MVTHIRKSKVAVLRGAYLFNAAERYTNIEAVHKGKVFYQFGIYKELTLKKGQRIQILQDPCDPGNYFVNYLPYIVVRKLI